MTRSCTQQCRRYWYLVANCVVIMSQSNCLVYSSSRFNKIQQTKQTNSINYYTTEESLHTITKRVELYRNHFTVDIIICRRCGISTSGCRSFKSLHRRTVLESILRDNLNYYMYSRPRRRRRRDHDIDKAFCKITSTRYSTHYTT